jgi:hypothetical protein
LAVVASDSWGQSKRSSAKGQQEQTQSQEQKAAPDQRGTDRLPFIVQPLPTKETAEVAQKEKREADEKTNADWWTWLLGVLTICALVGQLIVFIAQAYFLKGTLDATADAAKAAVNAAALASKHERAYMFTSPAEDGGVSIDYQQSTVQVKFEIENSGRTVGILKKLCLGFTTEEPTNQTATYEGDGFRTFDFDFAFKAGIKRPYFGPMQSPLPPITTFVVGYIDYIDIFKNPHFSRFCIRIDPDGSYRPTGPPAWNDWD